MGSKCQGPCQDPVYRPLGTAVWVRAQALLAEGAHNNNGDFQETLSKITQEYLTSVLLAELYIICLNHDFSKAAFMTPLNRSLQFCTPSLYEVKLWACSVSFIDGRTWWLSFDKGQKVIHVEKDLEFRIVAMIQPLYASSRKMFNIITRNMRKNHI